MLSIRWVRVGLKHIKRESMKAELLDYMGTDLTVANAARVSFNKESSYELHNCDHSPNGIETILKVGDKNLLKYLAHHNHWTPFSHPQITMRETVPIFVARQRFKHMVGFTYNEVSRLYVDDEPEFYVPDVWRSRPEGSVKQGSGDRDLSNAYCLTYTEVDAIREWESTEQEAAVSEAYARVIRTAEFTYKRMLEVGVAPEQARMVLPQSMYTSYYVTGSLAAWARAYKQRIDTHSQKEIQDLAKQWGELIEPLYPVSWEALTR